MLAWPTAIIFMVASALLTLLVVTRPERIVEVEVERRIDVPVEVVVEKPVGDLTLLPERDQELHRLGLRLAGAGWSSSADAILAAAQTDAAAGSGFAAPPGPVPLAFRLSTIVDPDLESRVGSGRVGDIVRRLLRDRGVIVDPNAVTELEVNIGALGGENLPVVIFASLDVNDSVLVERGERYSWTAAALHADWAVQTHSPSVDSEPYVEALLERLLDRLRKPTELGIDPASDDRETSAP